MTDAEREMWRNYADRKATWLTFPVATGGVVQEGHVRWCADKGHPKWYHLNELGQHTLRSVCPNCGDHVWNPETGEYTRVCLVK